LEVVEKQNKFRVPLSRKTKKRLNLAELHRGFFFYLLILAQKRWKRPPLLGMMHLKGQYITSKKNLGTGQGE
jgi:hypothetical protein